MSTPISIHRGWPHPDSPSRYGSISRLLHWGMAACFAVVFCAALAHYFAEDSALEAALWPLHKPTGALLMLLVLVRTAWASLQRLRPRATSAWARWGHVALYGLMWAVPAIALLRQYGSGRAFAPFGLPLMAARDNDRIEWMTGLGRLLHGELGWALLFLVLGHVAMVVWHRHAGRGGKDDVLPRMIG